MGKVIIEYEPYIIAELKRGRTKVSLAEELDCDRNTIANVADKHKVPKTLRIDTDREEITKLYREGLTCDRLSALFPYSKGGIQAAINRWGVNANRPASEALNKMSLNDLKSNWIDIEEPYIVTVGRKPKFYLIPIEGG
jgi:hypothetical protein